ncbi:bacterial luciferase-like protein [Hyaloscypha variabilis]
MGIGQWKDPADNSRTKGSLEYYTWLAKLADKGKITSIFFADTYAVMDTYEGRGHGSFSAGMHAMARVSKNVGFGITGSTSYITPYLLARTWATLDHATKGRLAWNVVTSYSESAAKAMGATSAIPHDESYAQADEYMDLMYSLWEGSWEDAHPSPQRTPVLFQAGASASGKQFAGKHAEAIFCDSTDMKKLAEFVREVRAIAVEIGRAATDVNFFPMIAPSVGRKMEEAQASQAKHDRYEKNADWEGGLATISSFMNIDFSKFPVDEPFDVEGLKERSSAIHSLINSAKNFAEHEGKPLTPRMLGHAFAFCGIADVFESFINEADVDGFNVAYVSNPESYEDLVELLIPVLMERGIMWKDYTVPGGTFLARFRYEELKERLGTDEFGDITIKRTRTEKKVDGVVNGMRKLEVGETAEAVVAKA